MKCDVSFKNGVLSECYDSLQRQGFSRYKKWGVDFPINNGFHCWVGLNTALYPDRLELIPNVGVHVVPIEKLICDLDNGAYAKKYDRSIATYSIGLWEVCGQENHTFCFFPEQSSSLISAECSRLASLYSSDGLRFARGISNYGKLSELLADRVDSLGRVPERYATCLYMLGKKLEAKEFLECFPADYKKYIEGFSLPFIDKIKNESVKINGK